jgi:DNA-binding transcriptional regulator YiaG
MPTADQIKAARESLGESQAAFAKRFRVNQSTVARWEINGLPDRGTAKVAVENLLGKSEEQQSQSGAAE